MAMPYNKIVNVNIGYISTALLLNYIGVTVPTFCSKSIHGRNVDKGDVKFYCAICSDK